MRLEDLIGRELLVSVSDPWDFVTEHGDAPFRATVEAASGEELLLRLPRTMRYEGLEFGQLMASARLEEPTLGEADRKLIPANFRPVPGGAGTPEGAFEAARSWRGWFLIGAVTLPGTSAASAL